MTLSSAYSALRQAFESIREIVSATNWQFIYEFQNNTYLENPETGDRKAQWRGSYPVTLYDGYAPKGAYTYPVDTKWLSEARGKVIIAQPGIYRVIPHDQLHTLLPPAPPKAVSAVHIPAREQ